MKKTAGLLLIGLGIAILANGQTIKVQGGTSISKLDWELNGMNVDPLYDEAFIGYSFFVGLDYPDLKYFNLSSNIGFIRKGGKDELQLINENGQLMGQSITDKATLDYLSVNTSIEFKYEIKEKLSPFISLGPRLDYLLSNSKQFDVLVKLDELNKISTGFIVGGGLKYEISSLQLGLRADYYLDFTPIADWTIEETGKSGEIKSNTFTLNLIFGYKLK